MMKFNKNIVLLVFIYFLLSIFYPLASYAQDALSKAELLFIQKKYWQTIEECNSVITANPGNNDILSKANYLAGASYVNLFDFLTGKKSFKSVVEKYPNSAYYEDSYIALGDVELLQENYREALDSYLEFYNSNPSRKRRATLYFRLAEVNLKLKDRKEFKKFYDKLQQEYPNSFEASDSRRLEDQSTIYTVQVGAFTNYDNAENFVKKLRSQGYDVYSVLCMLSGKKLCRIRVGKLKTRYEAEELKKRLEKDGYYAKIFP
ncbi:MAG TPA: SPOR domain-containing protein [Candidatus Omnitrophota bacterium]|nr:SPOR domain-containing protein [Candidatus Omnitrophota bacterium]